MSVKPRAGISYSNICTCRMKYNPLVFLSSSYVNAFIVNPLDHFSSRTYWQVSGQLHQLFVLWWKTRCYNSPVPRGQSWTQTSEPDSSHRLNGLYPLLDDACCVKGGCGSPEMPEGILGRHPLQKGIRSWSYLFFLKTKWVFSRGT